MGHCGCKGQADRCAEIANARRKGRQRIVNRWEYDGSIHLLRGDHQFDGVGELLRCHLWFWKSTLAATRDNGTDCDSRPEVQSWLVNDIVPVETCKNDHYVFAIIVSWMPNYDPSAWINLCAVDLRLLRSCKGPKLRSST